MNKNVIKEKSFQFAIRIVKLCKYLQSEKKEYVISKQVLRSGTSIGANVRESQNAESRADFIHKLAIAQKEADETSYWLELLEATEYIDKEEFNSLFENVSELIKIIRSIIITTKNNKG
jgi:four helix bundle protein